MCGTLLKTSTGSLDASGIGNEPEKIIPFDSMVRGEAHEWSYNCPFAAGVVESLSGSKEQGRLGYTPICAL